MNSSQFDLVTVGGGLGASALAISMARRGARVLVLEKETQFRDRVRGEGLAPWGVAEARALGVADLLPKTCAKMVPWVEMGFGPRNLIDTTPQKEPFLTYCHPEMLEVLLAEAEQAGAHVRRGIIVEAVEPSANHAVVSPETPKRRGFQRAWWSAQMAADQQFANGQVLQYKKARNPFTLPAYF